MAVSKKGKRKLIYKGRDFYWYMKLTEDWMYAYNSPQLHVVSADKSFIISYQPGQQNDNPFLIVKGKDFNGIKDAGGIWKRVKVPNWNDEKITPKFVADLIDWCFDDNKEVILVDYLGRIIDNE